MFSIHDIEGKKCKVDIPLLTCILLHIHSACSATNAACRTKSSFWSQIYSWTKVIPLSRIWVKEILLWVHIPIKDFCNLCSELLNNFFKGIEKNACTVSTAIQSSKYLSIGSEHNPANAHLERSCTSNQKWTHVHCVLKGFYIP